MKILFNLGARIEEVRSTKFGSVECRSLFEDVHRFLEWLILMQLMYLIIVQVYGKNP